MMWRILLVLQDTVMDLNNVMVNSDIETWNDNLCDSHLTQQDNSRSNPKANILFEIGSALVKPSVFYQDLQEVIFCYSEENAIG